MGRRCCVITCRNRKGRSDGSVFNVPKNAELFNQWCTNIASTGTILRKTSYVCQDHFTSANIKSENIIKDISGKVLFHRHLKKKSLRPGAIPTLFTDGKSCIITLEGQSIDESGCKPIEFNKDCIKTSDANKHGLLKIETGNTITKNEKAPCRTEAAEGRPIDTSECNNTVELDQDCMERNATEKEAVCIDNDSLQQSIASVEGKTSNVFVLRRVTEKVDTSFSLIERKEKLFYSFFNGRIKLDIPNLSWSRSVQTEPDKIIFQECGKLSKDHQVPWYRKQIVLNKQLHMEIYIFNKLVETRENLRSSNDVQEAISKVANFNTCNGGPLFTQYKHVTPRCAFKDCSNRWRHNLCPVQLERGAICRHCVSLENTLRQHFIRKTKGGRQNIVLSRLKKKKSQIARKAALNSRSKFQEQ